MEKKKFEVPTIEVFELELENVILQTSGSGEDMIPIEFASGEKLLTEEF